LSLVPNFTVDLFLKTVGETETHEQAYIVKNKEGHKERPRP